MFTNFRSRGWTAILAQLGIRYRKPYQARHTFITHCLQEGISVQQVAKWVGNSPEIIMKHYAGILEQLQVPEIYSQPCQVHYLFTNRVLAKF
ncbi:MAG: hypothetical protein AAGA83_17720 [Cyanobacteria bacterium P01_F01_bin.116]